MKKETNLFKSIIYLIRAMVVQKSNDRLLCSIQLVMDVCHLCSVDNNPDHVPDHQEPGGPDHGQPGGHTRHPPQWSPD